MKKLHQGIALLSLAALSLGLVGCGGGSGSASGGTPIAATSSTITPFKGPFYSGATVTLKDASGNPVTLTSGGTVNASGVINLSYPSTVSYPLIVEVTGSYYNEITGKAETTTVPLRGLITSAAGASNVPVTMVTEAAVADLQARLGTFSAAKPIPASSAVAALTAAGNMLGIPASAVPVFDSVTNKTADANTLRLAAMAVMANGQVGATLADKVKALVNSLVTNSAAAPTALISQTAYNAALTAMTSGASSVMAAGTTAPTPPTISTSSYGTLYAAAGGAYNTCPAGQVLNPLNVCVPAGVTGPATSGVPCLVAHYTAGAVSVPTSADLTAYAKTYNGDTLDPLTGKVVAAGGTTFVFSSNGALTYNGAAQTVASICKDNTLPMMYVEFGTGGSVDLFANGTFTGFTSTAMYQSTGFVPPATPPASAVAGLMGGAKQGTPLALTSTVSTFAGSAVAGVLNGVGTAATFNQPRGITTDGKNLYVIDRATNLIRIISIATGTVSTLNTPTYNTANPTGLMAPQDVTTDGTNLYVANAYYISKIVIATGASSILAGSATAFGLVDGTGAAARFFMPYGITTDGVNVYVADTLNNKIRQIVISTGVVTTIAATASGKGITTDGVNLYVAESGKISKIVIATGVVTTLAGSGVIPNVTVNGTGAAATFMTPEGITTDGTNLYVADSASQQIRKIVIATGVVTTLAGTGMPGAVNGTGTAASFYAPSGIITDGVSLYVSDLTNNMVRKIQ